jgi:hypothetical protein
MRLVRQSEGRRWSYRFLADSWGAVDRETFRSSSPHAVVNCDHRSCPWLPADLGRQEELLAVKYEENAVGVECPNAVTTRDNRLERTFGAQNLPPATLLFSSSRAEKGLEAAHRNENHEDSSVPRRGVGPSKRSA